MEDLSKAWKNGVRGKFRRVDGGKIKFIKSETGKVEKEAVTASNMAADLGTPSAQVQMTETGPACTCGKGKVCDCKMQKAAICKCNLLTKCGPCSSVAKNASTCDCKHAGLCKEAVDCDCDCADRETCAFRAAQ